MSISGFTCDVTETALARTRAVFALTQPVLANVKEALPIPSYSPSAHVVCRAKTSTTAYNNLLSDDWTVIACRPRHASIVQYVGVTLICQTETRVLANELHSRHEPLQAVTLIGRMMTKALFAGKSNDVLYWALVYAYYRGEKLSDFTKKQLASFRGCILPDHLN